MKRPPDIPRSKNSLPMRLLREIADTLWDEDRVVLPWAYRFGPMTEKHEAEMSRARRARRIRDALKRLQKQCFLEIRRLGDQMEITMTSKGEAACLLEKMRERPELADDRLLLISFDIPEQERSKRNLFTRELKYAGFQKMHASLWSANKDIKNELRLFLRLVGAEKWIRIYEARELSYS